jgi:hypothetical protein
MQVYITCSSHSRTSLSLSLSLSLSHTHTHTHPLIETAVRVGVWQAKTCEAVVEYSATADTRLLVAPGAAAEASLATYDFDTTRRTAVHGRAAINEAA